MFESAILPAPPIRPKYEMRHFINLVETAYTDPLDEFFTELEQKGIKPIEELQNIQAHKAKKFGNMMEFEKYMEGLGFHVLGTGWFSAVFSHPKLNYVLKVANLDGAYRKFVEYAFANSNNPHLPRFKGQLMQVTSDVFMIRMEMLNEIDPSTYDDSVNPCFAAAQAICNGAYGAEPDNSLTRTFVDIIGKLKGVLVKAGRWPAKQIRLDMKEDNVMCRADGTIVVTDPVAVR
jgi:hypothetical protein